MVGEKNSFREYYYEKLYDNINALRQFGFDAENIKGLVDKGYLILETSDAYLAHGDFDDSHIFWKNGQYTGIIDFGEIRGSHYLYDLGHYRLHDNIGGFWHLAKGYNEIKQLLSEDYVKIDYLALFVGLNRSKYEHYRNLVKKQLDVIEGNQ